MENEEDKIIYSVSIGDGMYDNDFTFYESGKIKRYWDENNWNYDNTAWLTGKEIKDSHKTKILEQLPDKLKEQISAILFSDSE
jgi:hypothetical protein|tara:strand:- start:3855 stop:4103 length:249 start_codon:yes stop_codon:yes gene_type:complete